MPAKVRNVKYVGIDVGKTRCRAALMDPEGHIVDELSFDNDDDGIALLSSLLTMDDRVVMGSTGAYWLNMYNRLDEAHIRVVLANPLKTRAIASAKIKSDKVDARILAHLLRADLIPEGYVPSREMREVRALVRHRLGLVRVRTMAKNRVHAIIDGYGFKYGFGDLFGKAGTKWLREVDLPRLDRLMLDNYLSQIENLNELVRNVDAEITARASTEEDVKLLLSLTGVDVYTALIIKSEVGDISRFPGYKKLVSWAGLAPSLYQSGSVEIHGNITRQGSRMLRYVMVESARVAANHDPRLRGFYERVKRRRGDQKAIVALANKMLKIVWFMLVRRGEYESVNRRSYGRKLNKVDG
jgi:transposase